MHFAFTLFLFAFTLFIRVMSFHENRKEHRERHQPARRARKGLLEKKKDYRLRARDYKSKRSRLQKLAEKAAFRNPDEFYYKMENTKRERGVFVRTDHPGANKYNQKQLVNMKTQDLAYLNYKKSVETSKIDTLHAGLHFLEEDIHDLERPAKKPRHTIFVDVQFLTLPSQTPFIFHKHTFHSTIILNELRPHFSWPYLSFSRIVR